MTLTSGKIELFYTMTLNRYQVIPYTVFYNYTTKKMYAFYELFDPPGANKKTMMVCDMFHWNNMEAIVAAESEAEPLLPCICSIT
jgi:hypothetical protein